MDCFGRANSAAEESRYKRAEEKVKLAVMGSYGIDGNLDDNLLKENVNNIDGLAEKVEDASNRPLGIIVDGYPFTIGELGEVTGERELADIDENTEAGKEVKIEDKWKTKGIRYVDTANGEEKEVVETASVYAVSDGQGNKVPVPYGFYYVGGTLETGVVISDNANDKNKYVNYKNNEDIKEGIPKNDLEGNQFVWIPCSIENYKKYNWGYNNTIGSWDTWTPAAEMTQIQKYGGFYVARYEAGTSEIKLTSGKKIGDEKTSTSNWQDNRYVVGNTTEDSKPTSKAGEIPYYYSDFTTAEEMSKRMYNTNYVNSGLITGTQWDVMLNYMSDEKNKGIENAGNTSNYTDLKSNCTWGNYNNKELNECDGKYCTFNTSNGSMISAWQENIEKKNRYDGYHTLLTTGSTEEVKKKNLYDVAGNLWEWTAESAETTGSYYMFRGGSFWNTYGEFPTCYRDCVMSTLTYSNYGFRVTLYIK